MGAFQFYFIVFSTILTGGVLYYFLRNSDPLPDKDPDSIWHLVITKAEKVKDGRTFFAYIMDFNHKDNGPFMVRIRGINLPKAKEKRAQAKKILENQLKNSVSIDIYNAVKDKRYDKLTADLFCDRKNIARLMVSNDLALISQKGKSKKGKSKKGKKVNC